MRTRQRVRSVAKQLTTCHLKNFPTDPVFFDSNNGGGTKRYDSDWDWDWQPANATWVCRGITTGQYAELSNCQYDIKDDNRWPN